MARRTSPVGERGAYGSAADPDAIHDVAWQFVHRNVQKIGHATQIGDAAFAAARKMEIVANDDMPRIQALHQHATNEIGRRYAAHRRGEMRAIEKIDAVLREAIEFLPKPHQAGRRPLTAKEFPRGRLETHYDRGHVAVGCSGQHPRKQLLMAQVQAVIGPDRHDAACRETRMRRIGQVT